MGMTVFGHSVDEIRRALNFYHLNGPADCCRKRTEFRDDGGHPCQCESCQRGTSVIITPICGLVEPGPVTVGTRHTCTAPPGHSGDHDW